MIFKSILNGALNIIEFFDLYKECIPCIIKILLVKFYLSLILTLKPYVYSTSWLQYMGILFILSKFPAKISFYHLKFRENTELYNHLVNVIK